MKQTKKSLSLTTQTVRNLSAKEMERAAGGCVPCIPIMGVIPPAFSIGCPPLGL